MGLKDQNQDLAYENKQTNAAKLGHIRSDLQISQPDPTISSTSF